MFNLISTDIAIFVYRGPWSRVYGISVRGGDRYDGDPRMRDPWRNRHDLFLARRQLECVNLLELGDDELAVHIVPLHLKGVDLHIIFLDLVFNVEPFGEGGAGQVVVLLD